MKLKNIIIILLAGFVNSMIGQQTPVFSNYSYNGVVINPAQAGFYLNTDITFTNSGYLNNIEGSPRNISLTVNIPTKVENVGLGAGISNDRIGVSNVTNFFGAYSYKLFFKSDKNIWWDYNPHVLSFGITGGASYYNENLLDLDIQDDPNFSNNINTVVPVIGAGIFYNKDAFRVGFSIPNLLRGKFASNDNLQINSTYYLHGVYRFFATVFREFMITPSFLIKHVSGAPIQVDLNTKVNYKNKFEIGVGYRTNNSINFLAGFHISNNFRLLYNYSRTINNLFTDSHGVVLNVRLGDGFL